MHLSATQFKNIWLYPAITGLGFLFLIVFEPINQFTCVILQNDDTWKV